MEDAKKREVMRGAYLLLEKHEKPVKDAGYWEALCQDCKEFVNRWEGVYKDYAAKIGIAVIESLEKELLAGVAESDAIKSGIKRCLGETEIQEGT